MNVGDRVEIVGLVRDLAFNGFVGTVEQITRGIAYLRLPDGYKWKFAEVPLSNLRVVETAIRPASEGGEES